MNRTKPVCLLCLVAFWAWLSLSAAAQLAERTASGNAASHPFNQTPQEHLKPGTDSLAHADAIIDVLRNDSNLIEEVKGIVAEQLRSEGTDTERSQISDEEVFDRIRQDNALRAHLTAMLLDRGEITREQLAAGNDPEFRADAPRRPERTATTPQGRRRAHPNAFQGPTKRTAHDDPAGATRPVANPYSDIPALQDLYTQFNKDERTPERFGSDLFRNTSASDIDPQAMDLPAGSDYVLGPGDNVTITLSGGLSQTLRRIVDREGRITLPEVGAVLVAGKNLTQAQSAVEKALATQFRTTTADLSLTRLRNVRVYVVGEIAQPHPFESNESDSEVPLAVIGVVPLKVTACNGPISIGDLLVSSPIAGRAMKGTQRDRMLGAVVGKALQPWSEGEGTIQVLVTLQ